uniref:Uncharacterized protein n=1 Tax=Knipowitschia caucasica TaxID=637954 RepID=A0AAV2KH85_KNICA
MMCYNPKLTPLINLRLSHEFKKASWLLQRHWDLFYFYSRGLIHSCALLSTAAVTTFGLTGGQRWGAVRRAFRPLHSGLLEHVLKIINSTNELKTLAPMGSKAGFPLSDSV